MEFIKKNWEWIVGGVLLTIIILYLKSRTTKKEILKDTGKAIQKAKLTPQEEKDMGELKKKLDECEEQAKAIRLAPGAKHPCESLRDAYAVFTKKQESSYGCGSESGYGCGESSFNNQISLNPYKRTEGLNVMDFSMGLDGLSLLEDKQLKRK